MESQKLEEINEEKDNLKEKSNKNRRGLRRNRKKNCIRKLSFVGVKAAGLSSKLSSFDSMLESLKLSVFFID